MNPFREAAKNLPGHWHKGDYADGQGNYCAAGHVFKAMGYTDFDICSGAADVRQTTTKPYLDEIFQQVSFEFSNGQTRYVAEINDDPTTTEDDIVAFLEKAAVRLDEKAGLP